jgi:DNA-binding GntR family transcriptional regulator
MGQAVTRAKPPAKDERESGKGTPRTSPSLSQLSKRPNTGNRGKALTGLDQSGGAAAAYLTLRTAIIEGRLGPGTRLVEQRLAEELNISRTPIREAVRMLTADGLIVTERHRGAIVRTLDRNDVLDLYELRARLEAYASERAATRITPEQLRTIEEGIRSFDRAVQNPKLNDLERTRNLSAANGQIHSTVLSASSHERLAHMMSITVETPLVFAAFRGFDKTQLKQSNLFHRLIRDALANQEPVRAGQLMHEHIMQGRDQILAEIGRESDVHEEPGTAVKGQRKSPRTMTASSRETKRAAR